VTGTPLGTCRPSLNSVQFNSSAAVFYRGGRNDRAPDHFCTGPQGEGDQGDGPAAQRIGRSRRYLVALAGSLIPQDHAAGRYHSLRRRRGGCLHPLAAGDKKPCGPLLLDHYFLSDDLPAELFAAAGLGVGTVGIMMCAYFVPFHITHGPPFHGSVGKESSCAVSGVMTIMCDPLTSHDCRA
jgi:hypothetical protein